MNEVEVLVRVILQPLGSKVTRLAGQLVVLLEDPVTCLSARPRADTERRDSEMVPHGPPRTAAVAGLLDLVDVRDCVVRHEYLPVCPSDSPGRLR
jgi:hypothetical protein